jgi:acetyl-CoA synthetase
MRNPDEPPADAAARVQELLALYGDPHASAAYLLCDHHDPSAVAYRVVSQDLSAFDLTYGELKQRSERFAAALFALGLRSGDRVATLMGKSVDYLVTVMAIWRLGAVHVPLFTAFAPAAIAYRLNRSHTKAVVCDRSQQSKLAPGEDIPANPPWHLITTSSGDDAPGEAIRFADLMSAHGPDFAAAALGGDAPLTEIYTSGTTGRPKGVVAPLRVLASTQIYAEYALGVRSDDVFWNAADPGWAYGLYCGVMATFTTGAMGILLEGGFSPALTFEVLSRYAVTNLTAAPTVYRSLRASGIAPDDLKLRCASSAGEPLTPEINEWATRILRTPVHDHYGQTEAGMLINNNHHPAARRPLKPGSMGQSMPGWTAVVLKQDRDELAPAGEVGCVAMDMARSPLAWFKGYINDPEKSAEKFSADGRWYITGDVGRMDDEGYFYFSSRDDDVILMAGYRIGPFDVESVIVTHPAVSECAVVAIPDAIRGEVIAAAIVLRQGESGSPALTEELQAHVKTRYAAHAYPRVIHYVAALPKTPSGKIQRFVVREQMRQQAQAAQSSAGPGEA